MKFEVGNCCIRWCCGDKLRAEKEKGGRIIPIKTGVKDGVKKAIVGAADPITAASKEELFNEIKSKPGFLGYGARRVARASTKVAAKDLRFAGRGSVGVGVLAATGVGTALYGARKVLKFHFKKKDEGQI